jgi:alpha-tubulin suppressor-like RCC1 family protein
MEPPTEAEIVVVEEEQAMATGSPTTTTTTTNNNNNSSTDNTDNTDNMATSSWLNTFGMPPQWNVPIPSSCLHCSTTIIRPLSVASTGSIFYFICDSCYALNAFGLTFEMNTSWCCNIKHRVERVVAGEKHVLVLTTKECGSIVLTNQRQGDGDNNFNRTSGGNSNSNDVNSSNLLPVKGFPHGSRVVSMAVGGEHNLVAVEKTIDNSTNKGNVYSFGKNNNYGQLGRRVTTTSASATECSYHSPEKAHLNVTIQLVEAGTNHSCFLSTTGVMFTCGSNIHHQLGRHQVQQDDEKIARVVSNNSSGGSTYFVIQPALVHDLDGIPGVYIVQMACGSHHTCVLTNVNDIYIWGTLSGQLNGNYYTINSSSGIRSGFIQLHRAMLGSIPLLFDTRKVSRIPRTPSRNTSVESKKRKRLHDGDKSGDEEEIVEEDIDPPIKIISTAQSVYILTKNGNIIMIHANGNKIKGTTIHCERKNINKKNDKTILCSSSLFHIGWSSKE